MNKMLLFLFTVILSSNLFPQVEFSTRLADRLNEKSIVEFTPVLVLLKDRVDVVKLDNQFYKQKVSLEERAYELITSLQDKANKSQANLKAFLDSKIATGEVKKYESFWVTNLIMVEATKSVIEQLLKHPDVEIMDLDAKVELDPYIIVESDSPKKTPESEVGLRVINADRLWRMGITGAGSLVMGMDTGVELSHPSISARWRGNFTTPSHAWFDPETSTATPTDCDNHGTHTMGTMVGRAGTDTIGVAYNAQWIAAKTICTSPATSKNIAGFQWAINPDGNPATITDMPIVISNSWFDPNITGECASIYKTTLDAVEAAGIAVVFSAGNSGPNASTITAPKNINTNEVNIFSVGSVNGNTAGTPISSFSSRGPSRCAATGALLIKPEVVAPGETVRSAVRGGGYSTLSGTSMAAPHVAGAVALLKQAAPTLTGKELLLALYNSARDLGTADEDNTFGKGIIDVFAAFIYLSNRDSVPPTRITNLTVGNQASNSLDLSWTVPTDTSPGGVVAYDIRVSNSAITDTNLFNAATILSSIPTPGVSGTTQSMTVSNLRFNTTYHFAMRARDVWGSFSLISNSSSGTTLSKPTVSLNRDSLSLTQLVNVTFRDSVIISNPSPTPSTLDFQISLDNHTFPTNVLSAQLVPVQGEAKELVTDKSKDEQGTGYAIERAGGPDLFGYRWRDSDEPNGPRFTWNSIATTGTRLTLGDDASISQTLPFAFNYYGVNYNTLEVVSNGYLRFTSYTTSYPTNGTIPATALPNNGVYGFWEDINPAVGGNIYVLSDVAGGRFIVEYNDIPRYNDAASRVTFQIELNRNGSITYRYLRMVGVLNSGTIGIENATGTDGLLVTFNANYVKDSLAILFQKAPDWLNVTTLSGRIARGNSMSVLLQMQTQDLIRGDYRMEMKVASNDSSRPNVTFPIRLRVIDGLPVSSIFTTQAGWNLVSVPLQMTSHRKDSLFPQAISLVYGFTDRYVVRDTLNIGSGFWVRYANQHTHTFNGNIVGSINVPLNAGWNLIGSLHDSIAVNALTTTPSGIISSLVYGYNNGYQPVSSLQRGRGYWVKTSVGGTLLLQRPVMKITPEPLAKQFNEKWPRLTLRDNAGKVSTVYIGRASESNKYELPPVPPEGIFDVRFSNNKLVSDLSGSEILNIRSASYPIEISMQNVSGEVIELTDGIDGSIYREILDGSKPIKLSDAGITSLRIRITDQKLSFGMEQNYPNPFNPSTLIRFTLPAKSQVKLSVYNMIGEEVAKLIDGELDLGSHEVEFNGINLPSGIYIYRITAGEYTATKKLTLLK